MTSIVEEVQRLPAGEKCLIFSQWDDMLSLIGRALRENGVEYRRLQGRASLDSALHGFRQSAEVRALLLPLKSGANGINLVEATHAFLAEPLLEQAVEAQAIGRVHRMSQTRPTVVHRFVMRGTIEEKISGAAAARSSGGNDGASPSRGTAAGGGSPNKRARRAAEESKFLSWETVEILGLDA